MGVGSEVLCLLSLVGVEKFSHVSRFMDIRQKREEVTRQFCQQMQSRFECCSDRLVVHGGKFLGETNIHYHLGKNRFSHLFKPPLSGHEVLRNVGSYPLRVAISKSLVKGLNNALAFALYDPIDGLQGTEQALLDLVEQSNLPNFIIESSRSVSHPVVYDRLKWLITKRQIILNSWSGPELKRLFTLALKNKNSRLMGIIARLGVFQPDEANLTFQKPCDKGTYITTEDIHLHDL